MTSIHRAADEVIGVVPTQVSPVSESGLRLGGTIWAAIFQVAVGRVRNTVPRRIDTCEDCDDVVRGVRDQWGVMIGKKRAILLDEIEQVRHLFKIGRDECRAVACGVAHEVRIVEDDSDNMADLPARRVELATSGGGGCRCRYRELRSCSCSL